MTGTKARPRAAVYLRISRDSEQDGAGIELQRKDCTALARRAGLDVVEVYAENSRSAYSGRRRPQWDRMLEAVEDGSVSVVVAWANDRLYRRVQDQLALMDALRSHGGKIVTVKDGETDPTSDSGRMTMTILASVAAFESERKGERQKRKHEEIAAAGMWSGGPRPFGFRPVRVRYKDHAGREQDATTLEPVPEEATAIRGAAAAILSGEGLRTVTRRWNEAGLRTPLASRKPGDPRPPYGGKPWHAKAVKGVLTSPMIAGLREHRGSLTKAAWPAIIDRRTWKRLVAEFDRRAEDAEAKFGRPDRPRYLLTGILRCTCGGPLNGNPNNGTAAYACLSEDHTPSKDRPRVRVNARPVEEHVLTMAAGMERDRTEVRDPGEAPELQRALDEIDEKRSAFLRKAARLDLDEADISDGLADLNRERQRLEELLEEELTSRQPATWDDLAKEIDAYDPEAADEQFFLDPETRAWIESLVERVDVRPAVRGRNRFDPSRFRIVWRDGVRDRPRSA